ncbi:MAG: acetate CoA-transferase subunit alpha [Bacillota bacterium]
MNKAVTIKKALAYLRDGMTVMIGGFMAAGTPHALIQAMVEKGLKDLTIIVNDTAFPGVGIGKLIDARAVKKVIASHIGTNPVTGKLMTGGEIEVDLVPQGTLVERIRCGGAGLGGVLTPTGTGTVVEQGKQKLFVNGREYLLELPLRADVALIKAHRADKAGNLTFRRAARNFNPVMATAADLVIAETEHLLEIGGLDPDEIMAPGIFVHMVIQPEGGKELG